MHFGIDRTPVELAAVATRLRNRLEAEMPLNADDLKKVSDLIDARLDEFAKRAGQPRQDRPRRGSADAALVSRAGFWRG